MSLITLGPLAPAIGFTCIASDLDFKEHFFNKVTNIPKKKDIFYSRIGVSHNKCDQIDL